MLLHVYSTHCLFVFVNGLYLMQNILSEVIRLVNIWYVSKASPEKKKDDTLYFKVNLKPTALLLNEWVMVRVIFNLPSQIVTSIHTPFFSTLKIFLIFFNGNCD